MSGARVHIAAIGVLALGPGVAGAASYECTIDQICQDALLCTEGAGLAFPLTDLGGRYQLDAPRGTVTAEPTPGFPVGAVNLVFAGIAGSTAMVTIGEAGRAVMSAHNVLDDGRVEVVTLIGHCRARVETGADKEMNEGG